MSALQAQMKTMQEANEKLFQEIIAKLSENKAQAE